MGLAQSLPVFAEIRESLLERYEVPTPNDWAAKYWDPIVGAEAKATREGVAMYDMTALTRFSVTGRRCSGTGMLRRPDR